MRSQRGANALEYLKQHYGLPLDEIDSVFGFAEHSPLYGGRPYWGPEITDAQLAELYDAGIGYRIPFTNHAVTSEEYEGAKPFLTKHHRYGNAVIVVSDELARWVRADYPMFRVEASAVKDVDTPDKVSAALLLYDDVVLPPRCSNDPDLAGMRHKPRIRLFANGGCAVNCPSRICYRSFSKYNKSLVGELLCSMEIKHREQLGKVSFDVDKMKALGFSKFKMVA